MTESEKPVQTEKKETRVREATSRMLADKDAVSKSSRLQLIKSLTVDVEDPEVSTAFESFINGDFDAPHKLALIKRLNATPSPACARIGISALDTKQHESVRVAAADLLGKMSDEMSLQSLRIALQDSSDAVVTHCARSLGKRADSASEDELLSLLGRSRMTVRLAAARALSELGSAASLVAVQHLAKTEKWPFRLLAKDSAKRLEKRTSGDGTQS